MIPLLRIIKDIRVQAPLAACCLGFCTLAVGCGEKAKAQAGTQVAALAPSWNWEEYPPVSRMRLGVLPCQLQPRSMITMHSPLMGTLRLYISSPQTNLAAGALWAEFEPEIFAAEAKSLEESRIKLEEREKLQSEIELPRQRLQLERQIEEMQRQVALVRLLSTNKELADLTLSVGGDSNSPLRPDAVAKSELELRLLHQSLTQLEQTNSALMGVDLSSLRTDWERRKLDFERRQGQARFKMPFDGRLTLSLPFTEGVSEYPVTLGQELAVARDLGSIRVRIALPNAAWSSVPAERLTAVIRLPTGPELHAPFLYQKIERVQNREEAVYYFQFPQSQSAAAARLVGTDTSCELWMNLEEPARLVPKLKVVLYKPDALEGRSWSHGVGAAFPGARLLVEGQTDLAVALPGQKTSATN